MFIQLTEAQANGPAKIMVNPDHIVMMRPVPHPAGTDLVLTGTRKDAPQVVRVQESMEAIDEKARSQRRGLVDGR